MEIGLARRWWFVGNFFLLFFQFFIFFIHPENYIFVMSIFVSHDMRQSFADKSLIISDEQRYLHLCIFVIVHQYLKCIPKANKPFGFVNGWRAWLYNRAYTLMFSSNSNQFISTCIFSPIPTKHPNPFGFCIIWGWHKPHIDSSQYWINETFCSFQSNPNIYDPAVNYSFLSFLIAGRWFFFFWIEIAQMGTLIQIH